MFERRIVFVLWSGDYGTDWKRLASGGAENYYAQRYSMEVQGRLAQQAEVTVINITTKTVYDERMSNGVRAIGLGLRDGRSFSRVIKLLEELKPTHLVLATPEWRYLSWAMLRNVRVLPFFADSFRPPSGAARGARDRLRRQRYKLRHRALAYLLNRPAVSVIGNHNVPASEDLVGLGVDANKVVPWDWPPIVKPEDHAPKKHPGGRSWSLRYVGGISYPKGLGDVLSSIAVLRKAGRDVRLTVIGRGDLEPFKALAGELGIREHVDFKGEVPHAQVVSESREVDVALVASWHECPEGLPMTIYESLATHTPLVCSDHPMFVGRVAGHAQIFKEKDPRALATRIEELMDQPQLYERLSQNASAGWRKLQCAVHPHQLVQAWLEDTSEDRAFLRRNALAQRGAKHAAT